MVGLGFMLVFGVRLVGFAQRRPPPTPRPSSLRSTVWDFAQSPVGPMRAVVMVPEGLAPGARLPLLVTFHGWGESVRGVERGAWGWARDYELGASDRALRQTPLGREAFLGWVSPRRFELLRRDLAERPYQGLIVVAPYTPDVLDHDAGAGLSERLGQWVVDTLVAKARRELPVLTAREATGVDGVSLGGLVALEVGFGHPETFGAVGSLQAALDDRTERVLARWAPSATRPPQRVRLVTTVTDPLRHGNERLHAALQARQIAHDWLVVEGPHDYVFNRGAGGVEMLLFHDRALRGLGPR